MTTNNETTIKTTVDASYAVNINFKVINLHRDHIDHRARSVHDILSESNMEVHSDEAIEVIDLNDTLNHNADKALKSDHTSI
eukprot:9272672-Karenia_brevis.AAC.1